jgi:CDGSH-type Zn-finger protein
MTSEKSTPKIKVTKNGPYLVTGGVPVSQQEITTDDQGTPTQYTQLNSYPQTENCALCRCGNSEHKPFCDGHHLTTNFDGTETAGNEEYLNQPKIIEGSVLKLNDVEELCASARFCHRDKGIWNLVPESDHPKSKRIACEEAADCPSGRLVIQDKKTGKLWSPILIHQFSYLKTQNWRSGPIWVRGGIPVESAEDKIYKTRNRLTLCRCGKSQNKPFCDSSHYPDEHELHGEVE